MKTCDFRSSLYCLSLLMVLKILSSSNFVESFTMIGRVIALPALQMVR